MPNESETEPQLGQGLANSEPPAEPTEATEILKKEAPIASISEVFLADDESGTAELSKK